MNMTLCILLISISTTVYSFHYYIFSYPAWQSYILLALIVLSNLKVFNSPAVPLSGSIVLGETEVNSILSNFQSLAIPFPS